jgi:stage III sporulation protein SpoIIIAA
MPRVFLLQSQEEEMAAGPKKRGAQDRTRINMHQDYEVQYRKVQYRTKVLGVTKEQLAEAISKVGNSTQAVLRERRL